MYISKKKEMYISRHIVPVMINIDFNDSSAFKPS